MPPVPAGQSATGQVLPGVRQAARSAMRQLRDTASVPGGSGGSGLGVEGLRTAVPSTGAFMRPMLSGQFHRFGYLLSASAVTP